MIANATNHRLTDSPLDPVLGLFDPARELSVLQSVMRTVCRVALISTDASGIITSFNCGAEVLTGYTAEEVVGCSTPLLFHVPEEVDARRRSGDPPAAIGQSDYQLFTRDATLEGIDESECTYRRKDGREIAVYIAIQPLQALMAGDPSSGYLSVVRVAPVQATGSQAAPMRAFGVPVLDPPKEGVLELSRDWAVLYRNDRALVILPDLALKKNVWKLYPALLGTSVENDLRRAMEDRVQTSYENHYEPLDQWFRVYAVPDPSGIKVLFQDITVTKKAAAQLEREKVLREKRIEAISHMAGGLAHEISNPLAIINMMAGDLEAFAAERDLVDATEVKTTCAIILETSNRAMAILRGLKGFAREASKDPMVEASIAKIISDCLQLQHTRFERNGIELRVKQAGDIPDVLCREVQVGQIVNNLLNNAFDSIVATVTSGRAAGGWVGIETTSKGETVCVDVTDSGPGVPEEAKPHLMQPFFTTKEIGGGTGIGLSLSRAIAEDHGGTLTLVEHDGPTCFRLVLPVKPAIKQSNPAADSPK